MNRIPLASVLMCAAFFGTPIQHRSAAPAVAPFGSWKSPISAKMLVAKSVRFGDLSIDGDTVYLDRIAAGGAGPQRDRPPHAGRQDRRRVAAAV